MPDPPDVVPVHALAVHRPAGDGLLVHRDRLPRWVVARIRADFGGPTFLGRLLAVDWCDEPTFWRHVHQAPSRTELRSEPRHKYKPTLGFAPCPRCLAGSPCDAWAGVDLAGHHLRTPGSLPVDAGLEEEKAWARGVLGVVDGVDALNLRAAFRVKARSAHPDHGGSDEKMAELNKAYEILKAQTSETNPCPP